MLHYGYSLKKMEEWFWFDNSVSWRAATSIEEFEDWRPSFSFGTIAEAGLNRTRQIGESYFYRCPLGETLRRTLECFDFNPHAGSFDPHPPCDGAHEMIFSALRAQQGDTLKCEKVMTSLEKTLAFGSVESPADLFKAYCLAITPDELFGLIFESSLEWPETTSPHHCLGTWDFSPVDIHLLEKTCELLLRRRTSKDERAELERIADELAVLPVFIESSWFEEYLKETCSRLEELSRLDVDPRSPNPPLDFVLAVKTGLTDLELAVDRGPIDYLRNTAHQNSFDLLFPSQAFMAMVYAALKGGLKFKQCKHCQRLFVKDTSTRNQSFCCRKDESGLSCKEAHAAKTPAYPNQLLRRVKDRIKKEDSRASEEEKTALKPIADVVEHVGSLYRTDERVSINLYLQWMKETKESVSAWRKGKVPCIWNGSVIDGKATKVNDRPVFEIQCEEGNRKKKDERRLILGESDLS